ncbi:hypothetical protein [Streptomyces sp. NBC_00236]|uniref:hypothetical protein n=1 Tax=Streptomyces sp. NBC_00236 TaxID=2903639 RepID=UPI002E28A41F|nr:hypothetical protein [Streptomyces sp. NBC_00236]
MPSSGGLPDEVFTRGRAADEAPGGVSDDRLVPGGVSDDRLVPGGVSDDPLVPAGPGRWPGGPGAMCSRTDLARTGCTRAAPPPRPLYADPVA